MIPNEVKVNVTQDYIYIALRENNGDGTVSNSDENDEDIFTLKFPPNQLVPFATMLMQTAVLAQQSLGIDLGLKIDDENGDIDEDK